MSTFHWVVRVSVASLGKCAVASAFALAIVAGAEAQESALTADLKTYTRGEGAILVLPGVEAPAVAARVKFTTEGGRA